MSQKRSSKPKRDRGVILTARGWQKLQQAMQVAELEQNWGQRFTREQLSERTGLSLHTISRILKREEAVDRLSIEYFLRGFNLQLAQGDCSPPTSPFEELATRQSNPQQDWGEAIDVSVFFGREEELTKLQQWLSEDRCRLVTLLGIGGIGKSSLAVKLAVEIQAEYETIVWRSLQNAPPLEELLLDVLSFFLHIKGEDAAIPASLGGKLSALMDCLRQKRCLLILDNVETILDSGRQVGQYRIGYEEYGQLFKAVGEVPHQSCLLLTSREKPREMTLLEGKHLPVRSLILRGLHFQEGQDLFQHKGEFTGTETEWNKLIEHYGGNPLALKLVASATQEFLNGNISTVLNYIEQGTSVFDDIRNLLERQFERLSPQEQEVMLWLAVHREPISLEMFNEEIVTALTKRSLPNAISSLVRRSLIEQSAGGFSLQPVVMEYVTERLVKQVSEEISRDTQLLNLLHRHALMQATVSDYIQEIQVRLIVQPIIENLLSVLGSQQRIEQRFREILEEQRQISQPGYIGGNLFNLLVHLKTDLRGWDFSGLSIWQADLRQVSLPDVNFQDVNLVKSALAETLSGVVAIAFSPDGKILATGDVDGQICLWQVADYHQILVLTGHKGWVWSVCFSPDGQTLASCSSDSSIKIWNVNDGQCLKTLLGHTDWVWSVSFSPNGETLASSSSDTHIRLWDVRQGQCNKVLQHDSVVGAIAFSPDGEILASGSHDTKIRVWKVRDGQCIRVLNGHNQGVRALSFSPDGSILASGSEDTTVRLWDVKTGQCNQTLLGHTSGLWAVSFSPDSSTLASSGDDTTVRLWDVQSGQCLKVLSGHTNWVHAVCFSPDGTLLASGSVDLSVRFWSLHKGHIHAFCMKVLQGHRSGLWTVSFSPKERSSSYYILASGGYDAAVRLWDSSGKCLRTLQGHTSWVRSVCFSPEGNTLASGSFDRSIRLWDTQSGRCLKVFQGHTSGIRSVCFSPDGQQLVSAGFDLSVRLWNVQTSQCLKVLQDHSSWVYSVSFSPDGQWIASAGDDASVRLWNSQNGQCVNVLQGHTSAIWEVSFSPNGRTLATGSFDASIRLWDLQQDKGTNAIAGQCFKILQGHTSGVRSVSFSPDGQRLASCGDGTSIRLWDVQSGECLKVLQGHTSQVWSVSFSPDGKILASGSQDETMKLWDVETGNYTNTLRPERLYENMKIAGITGLTDAQKATLRTLGAVES
jgi:WD40 repeat protein